MKTSVKENFPKERDEHPFAPFVRILGKGKKGSRSLTREEAAQAMGMILDHECIDLQLGAFLMLLRVKEESPEELCGFVEAAQERFQPSDIQVDVDWSSYAGKKRHQPWFLFSAMLLAGQGIRIFMHGSEGHTQGRLYTRDALLELGLPVAESWADVAKGLQARNFVYMPLLSFSPRLHEIIQMRSLLGLRSPVHSMARLLNPLKAPLVLQGIFHPPYSQIHQQAAQLLGYDKTLVIKGEGGEFERNPDASVLTRYVRGNELVEEEWPALFSQRHVKPQSLSIEQMKAVWQGREHNEYAEMAVISTAALVIAQLQEVPQQQALEQARQFWEQRDRSQFA